jgi:pimeloyl-ACP methyl ester carboxylesterase
MIGPRSSQAAVRPVRLALLGPALILALALAGAAPAVASPAARKPAPPRQAEQPTASSGEIATARATTPEEELRQLDAARFATMVAGDTARLKNVLGEDLSYTHSNGEVQDRSHFLDALSAGTLRYEAMAPSDVLVRIYGPTGVVTGRVDMKASFDGRENTIAARYTAVYVRRDLRWQLVAWQSSPLAAANQPAQ